MLWMSGDIAVVTGDAVGLSTSLCLLLLIILLLLLPLLLLLLLLLFLFSGSVSFRAAGKTCGSGA